MLLCCEVSALLAGIFYFRKMRNTYWAILLFYLAYVVCYELLTFFFYEKLSASIWGILIFIQIPLEFMLYIWLYASKSLKRPKLFWIFTFVFIGSVLIDESIEQGDYYFNSFNYIIGSLILLILVTLEYFQQIKSDDILVFKQNRMFYVNIGVVLFFIGNLPFFGLYYPMMKQPDLWNNYYIYFMLSNCALYLLLAASFIWGKEKS